MSSWSNYKNPFVFFAMMVIITAVSFHSLAYFNPQDPNDIGDTDLPSWCPPADNPGLAVVCGQVVTSSVNEVAGAQVANVPMSDVMVAAYEDNGLSPTGKIAGKLTNIFSSTKTNGLGTYRLLIRRVKAPRLKVHLVFLCSGKVAQESIIDSWHNTWGLVTQVNCEPNIDRGGLVTTTTTAAGVEETPPFPLKYTYSDASFLGCTNEYKTDIPIGLSKKQRPVINTVISEDNFDHRFTLNEVQVKTQIDLFNVVFGDTLFSFRSPGGLWEPDCLLRNEAGIYQCNVQSSCNKWEKYSPQPCTAGACHDQTGPRDELNPYDVTPSYSGVKLYARDDCRDKLATIEGMKPEDLYSPDPAISGPAQEALEDCEKAQQEVHAAYKPVYYSDGIFWKNELIDGVLCNTSSHNIAAGSSNLPAEASQPMKPEDWLTRPFFKYIPKGPEEYTPPFRRFEYRNNLENFSVDIFAPMQWINTYIGSASNSGTGPPASAVFRGFLRPVSTDPDVPNCDTFYNGALPWSERGIPVRQERMINSGPITALSEPYSTFEDLYYSGQRNLSDYVCQQTDGELIRLCEIQVPWGPGALCDANKGGCKDPDLKSNLNKSLSRLRAPNTLIDPNDATQIEQNISDMLEKCGGNFKLNKIYFAGAEDLIFKVGNTQMGLHNDTPNDSASPTGERRNTFEPANSENQFENLTGSRVAMQAGGNFQPTSSNTVLCAQNPRGCINNKNAASFTDVLTLPYTESLEDVKLRYLNDTTWTIDNVAPSQTSMCSISNIYQENIRGPEQETEGMDPNPFDEQDIGGFFDQLFTGNPQHHENMEVGTATWYMSSTALSRDLTTKNACQAGVVAIIQAIVAGSSFSGNWREVGTSEELLDGLFTTMCAREVWDSMLTMAGGDAKLHDLQIELMDIAHSILGALSGGTATKSYGDRSYQPIISETVGPDYVVTFDYPVVESTILEKFRLPGEVKDADGNVTGYERTDLFAEEWGPGHTCYNFDTPVPQGQICGTLREAPEGVSRTCRLDQCARFQRLETARCTCTKTNYSHFRCGFSNFNDKHLVIGDCRREDRLWCAETQETSRTWVSWEHGYGEDQRCVRRVDGECVEWSPYFRDGRTEISPAGYDILPPDNIDRPDYNPDDEHDTPWDAPHFAEDDCNEGLFQWNDNLPRESQSKTLVGEPGNSRPRCWVTAAGPFRKFPDFAAAGEVTPIPTMASTGEQINNCNGYIRIVDSAMRSSQEAPFPEYQQVQHNLDESTILGVKMLKTFAPPWYPTWSGQKLALLDADASNNGLVADEGLLEDTFLKGQELDMGGVGDVSTLRNFFTPPVYIRLTNDDIKLKPVQFHCELAGTYTPDTGNDVQPEINNVLSGYDPDFDGIDSWTCLVVDPPIPQFPNIENKGGSCALRNPGNCTRAIADAVGYTQLPGMPPYEFSSFFKAMINWASYYSNTPAAALLAVMYAEGGLLPEYLPVLSDSTAVFNYGGSPWFGQMDFGGPATCNDLVWTAQGPYQLLLHWVQVLAEGVVDPEKTRLFCSRLNVAGFGRCEKVVTAGRCNYLDASMLAAFLMNPSAGTLAPGQCSADFDIDSALKMFSGGSYAPETIGSARAIYDICNTGTSVDSGGNL